MILGLMDHWYNGRVASCLWFHIFELKGRFPRKCFFSGLYHYCSIVKFHESTTNTLQPVPLVIPSKRGQFFMGKGKRKKKSTLFLRFEPVSLSSVILCFAT